MIYNVFGGTLRSYSINQSILSWHKWCVDDDNAVLCLGVVVAVILACVGFIIVLVALGVRRIRNAGRHSRRRCAAAAADMAGVGDDKQEMEWDNSALTITVNPMDQQVATSWPASAAFLTILYALCLSGPCHKNSHCQLSFSWTTIFLCVDSRPVLEIVWQWCQHPWHTGVHCRLCK